MNQEEIKRLLEKYYNAETTEDEELCLYEFFLENNNVPQELLDDKEIFNCIARLSEIPEPSPDFERRIISAIDSDHSFNKKVKRRRLYLTVSGIAAGLLILAGSYFFLNNNRPRDTFSDPEIAYAETMKILYSVSVRLNKGTSGLEQVGKLEEITKGSLQELNKPAKLMKEKMKVLDLLQNKEIDKITINN